MQNVTRPPVKQTQIETDLRSEILKNIMPPGCRLPTRIELEERYNVSSVTVQRALDRLIHDGFVYARGRQGTFVADHPPHLCRYGLVFPRRPTDNWVRFWTALCNEAMNIEQVLPRKIPIYYGIDGHSDIEDYQKILADVRSQRLAGLIFAMNPRSLIGTGILEGGNLPRVSIAHKDFIPGIPSVSLNNVTLIDKALDHLNERGRKNVAFLIVPGLSEEYHLHLQNAINKRGMATRPYWTQSVSPTDATWAYNIVHLMMNADQKVRPDGLVIADDNLVEHATAGLVAAGVKVPQDVEVVAHCNFPWPTPSVLPVRRLGFDARQVLQQCIDLVDQQRRGETPAAVTTVSAIFENEVK